MGNIYRFIGPIVGYGFWICLGSWFAYEIIKGVYNWWTEPARKEREKQEREEEERRTRPRCWHEWSGPYGGPNGIYYGLCESCARDAECEMFLNAAFHQYCVERFAGTRWNPPRLCYNAEDTRALAEYYDSADFKWGGLYAVWRSTCRKYDDGFITFERLEQVLDEASEYFIKNAEFENQRWKQQEAERAEKAKRVKASELIIERERKRRLNRV